MARPSASWGVQFGPLQSVPRVGPGPCNKPFQNQANRDGSLPKSQARNIWLFDIIKTPSRFVSSFPGPHLKILCSARVEATYKAARPLTLVTKEARRRHLLKRDNFKDGSYGFAMARKLILIHCAHWKLDINRGLHVSRRSERRAKTCSPPRSAPTNIHNGYQPPPDVGRLTFFVNTPWKKGPKLSI